MHAQSRAVVRGRPAFADHNPVLGSHDELAEAARTYLAYAGRYDLDPDGTVNHRIDCSPFANWCGQTQKRTATLHGDELRLVPTSPIVSNGVAFTARLSWRKN